MTLFAEEKLSDSPFVEAVTRGHTVADGATVRPAEVHWHMVFVREHGRTHALVVGPCTTAGTASWGAGAEILWVKFRLGAFMPHLPVRDYLDVETRLPGTAGPRFWLYGSTWQLPDFENVDTFVARLVREEVLVLDPLIGATLQDRPADLSPRTLRHRFLRATGQSQAHIRQFERAGYAAALLQSGTSILDTVEAAGYYDQPHLTRALKRFVGYTPAETVNARSATG